MIIPRERRDLRRGNTIGAEKPSAMNRRLRLATVLFGAFAITAPALAAPNWPDIVTQHVAVVRKTIKTTDMAGYLAAVKNPNGAVLIDVREPEEYKAGHIPGTINIPRGVIEFVIYKQLGYPKNVDTNRKIYVQCKTGGRATLATAALKKIGFKNAVAVIMNIDAWQKAGHPWVK